MMEYARENDGYLISHELFLYTFDSLLMLGMHVVLILHPARVGPGKYVGGEEYLELR